MAVLRQWACMGFLLAVVPGIGLSYPVQSSQSASPEDPNRKAEGQENKKRVYTNDDLIQLRDKHKGVESYSSSPGPSPEKPKDRGGSEKGASLSGYRDLNGHDREYWRKKIKPLKAELEILNSEIGAARQKLADLGTTEGLRVSRDGHLRAPSKGSQQDLSRKLEGLERKRGATARSIQDLEEEARKAQALPEWLR